MREFNAHASRRALVLAKVVNDPRAILSGSHHLVLDEFERQGRRITLRYFTWERPGAHRYQPVQEMTHG